MITISEAVGRPVSRETLKALEIYSDLLCEEASRQNLVSARTLDDIFTRHLLDSAQLVRFEANPGSAWLDIGSGAGLPGIIIAMLAQGPVTLVEPRALRADFLRRAKVLLELRGVTLVQSKVERISGQFDLITARAVAPLSKLLGMAEHLSHSGTLWVLPKGRSAKSELAEAERSWHYDVRAEPSCTDPESSILLLSNVRARAKR